MNNSTRTSKDQFFHPSVPGALRRAGEELDFIAANALEAQAAEIERLERELGCYVRANADLANQVIAHERAAHEPRTGHKPGCAVSSYLRGVDRVVCDCGGTSRPPCVHPWESIGVSQDGHPFCAACVTNLVKDPPWSSPPPSPDDAKDAERYRWLRDRARVSESPGQYDGKYWQMHVSADVETLDAAIDAACSSATKESAR